MKLYIKKEKMGVDAKAEYNMETGEFIVLKGSKVSNTVSNAEKFRGIKSINKNRATYVRDYIVQQDVKFTSSSTAGNFVTGRSTDGPSTWKDENGITLKKMMTSKENANE